MKMRFDAFGRMVAALVAAAMSFAAAAPCIAATAGEVFAAHEAEIATNRCVVVGGYVFGIGRALSGKGGDSVGFAKARILAQSKILQYAGIERLDVAGMQTVCEKCEAPGHYMAVVAVGEAELRKAQSESLGRRGKGAAPDEASRKQAHNEEIEEYEPRGYWEEDGIKANETMSESQFL